MWRPFRWRPSKIDMKRCCQGGDERDESRAEMHPRNKCKANVCLLATRFFVHSASSVDMFCLGDTPLEYLGFERDLFCRGFGRPRPPRHPFHFC